MVDLSKEIHTMIDLETLSSKSNGAIVEIGACEFNVVTGGIVRLFHQRVTLDLYYVLKYAPDIDMETVKWWQTQGKEKVDRLLNASMNGVPEHGIAVTLKDLKTNFLRDRELKDIENMFVWSHGSNFDTVLLENAYRSVGQEVWWKYKNVRDTRTLFALLGYEYKAKGGHNALEDALFQAEAVCKCYQKLLTMRREENGQSH